jgi:hypothetical protein
VREVCASAVVLLADAPVDNDHAEVLHVEQCGTGRPTVSHGVPGSWDGARRLSRPGDVTELLSDAVQRGLCMIGALGEEIEDSTRRGTAIPRSVLRDVAEGVRSAGERQAKALWRRARLPEARWNVPVYDEAGRLLGIADCWVDDVAVVWETESTEWHLSPADHDATVERAAAFTAAGAVCTATKPKKLRTDPQGVVAVLRATHERARARVSPPASEFRKATFRSRKALNVAS